jgi:hypothetical protein
LPNAMNAAEITDKLGLHSLRQRAWVRHPISHTDKQSRANSSTSTSNPPALRPVTVSTKVSNGSATPSARLVTTRRTPLFVSTFPRQGTNQSTQNGIDSRARMTHITFDSSLRQWEARGKAGRGKALGMSRLGTWDTSLSSYFAVVSRLVPCAILSCLYHDQACCVSHAAYWWCCLEGVVFVWGSHAYCNMEFARRNMKGYILLASIACSESCHYLCDHYFLVFSIVNQTHAPLLRMCISQVFICENGTVVECALSWHGLTSWSSTEPSCMSTKTFPCFHLVVNLCDENPRSLVRRRIVCFCFPAYSCSRELLLCRVSSTTSPSTFTSPALPAPIRPTPHSDSNF